MGVSSLYLSKGSMSFGGVDASPDKALAIIVGVPYDFTSSYRPGSRFAPQAIRSAAANIEFYSLRGLVDVNDYKISDLGDIFLPISPQAALGRIKETILELLREYRDKLLIVLGGEHTITIATYSAVREVYNNACLLVFDAHFDLRDQYMEDPLSHACVLRRIVEKYGGETVFVVGVRAFTREEIEYARSSGIEYVTPHTLRLLGVREVINRVKNWLEENSCDKIYISVDMDVFDPAFAPGVGNPEPEGLEPWHVYDILFRSIIESDVRPVAADIVEVSPPYDCSGITSVLAAKTALEIIALNIALDKRRGKS